MSEWPQVHCTAFSDGKYVASGSLEYVASKAKAIVDIDPNASVLIFDDATSRTVEVDFRGTVADVLKRIAQTAGKDVAHTKASGVDQEASRGRGRPKLGVVSREVTLLPRHWEWLSQQPGGASVVLRKLVEEAKRAGKGKDRIRRSQESCFRFMSVMAGNLPHFEDASRALFASDRNRFFELVEGWPIDIRDHAKKLAADTFVDPASGDRP